MIASKYPVNDTKSTSNSGLSAQPSNSSTLTTNEESKTKILYMQCSAYKLNAQKEWGSLGKIEIQVFKTTDRCWIEFYNPDTKRCIFSSQIHVGVIAKLEGNFVRLIFPMKPDSALFGVKSGDAERLYQLIKKAIREDAICVVENYSDNLVLDSKRISWNHLKYKEIRPCLEKYVEMFIPEYKDIVHDISIWNNRLDNPSILCHPAGDFAAAFTKNDSIFLGPVQVTLFEYGLAPENAENGGLLAIKMVIRSINNPTVIYFSCGLERIVCCKSSIPNVLNLVIDSGADYSLSCKDLNHCNSLYCKDLESFQKSQIFKKKKTKRIFGKKVAESIQKSNKA